MNQDRFQCRLKGPSRVLVRSILTGQFTLEELICPSRIVLELSPFSAPLGSRLQSTRVIILDVCRCFHTNVLLGTHKGLWYHTVGQRKGVGNGCLFLSDLPLNA